ncbi:MAG: helix-turn-helix domain-containing protein [Lachnospiraceae bacterium]|nr:helix-turn-helix domain-containing protein [Lachnospiraceae bacterium]
MHNRKYIIPAYTTGARIKEIRSSLHMTQREFAEFIGTSKPTVERWEAGSHPITGPVVLLIELLWRDRFLPEKLHVPANRLKLRLYYMYEDSVCTIIDVDEMSQRVEIKNYTDDILFRAFGKNTEPTFTDYEEFIESRCFPRTRDKVKLELEHLGIPFYDPIMIIEKTQGRMAEDHFWIKLER